MRFTYDQCNDSPTPNSIVNLSIAIKYIIKMDFQWFKFNKQDSDA